MVYLLFFVMQVSPEELARVVEARFNQIQTLEAEVTVSVKRPAYVEFLAAKKQARAQFGRIVGEKFQHEESEEKFVSENSTWSLSYDVDQGITWSRVEDGQVVQSTNFDGKTWRSFRGKAGVVYDSPVDIKLWQYFGFDYRFDSSSPKAGCMLFDQIQQAYAMGSLKMFGGRPAGFGLGDRSYVVSQDTEDQGLNEAGVRNLHILTFDPDRGMVLTKVHTEYFHNNDPTQPRRWSETEWRYSRTKALNSEIPEEFSERLFETVTFPRLSLTRDKLESNSGKSDDFEFRSFNTTVKNAVISNVRLNQGLAEQAFEFPDGTLVNDRVQGLAYQVGDPDPEIEAMLAIQNAFPVNSVNHRRPTILPWIIFFVLSIAFLGWFVWKRTR